ncbi:MAG: class I SAM-dependent methyltransferase [Acetobacteraceae bacterium]
MSAVAAGDPFWSAAARALRDARAVPAGVLAPLGFGRYLAGAREYAEGADLFALAGADAGWLVVHKGQLASLPTAGLAAALVDARLIFANEVFVVFTLAPPAQRQDPHAEAFRARLRAADVPAAGSDEPADTGAAAPSRRRLGGLARRVLRLPGPVRDQAGAVTVTATPPTLEHPVSQACTQAQFETDAYRYWCGEIREEPRHHRKQWEFCYILQALGEAGMLAPGRSGLGYGVGTEPLTAVFAARGCAVVATDLDVAEAQRIGWAATNEHAGELAALNARGICPPERFAANVRFRVADMNAIPEDLRGFDFTWSACCLEHLGSIRQGLAFIENSLATLRPGGVAVHTTELNCSSDRDTIDHAGTVLFRRRDLMALARRLAAAGHALRLNFNLGDQPLDVHVDAPPYAVDGHLKLLLENFVTTSFGLIVRKAG